MIDSPNISTAFVELQEKEASGLKQRLNACLLSVTEGLVPNVATLIFVRTYKLRAANNTLQPLRRFVSRNP